MKIYWITQTVEELPNNTNWLHSSEMEVLASLRFDKRKQDWLLGRWTAKNAIKYFLKEEIRGIQLSEIQVMKAVDGAPEILLPGNILVPNISISHSYQTGFCAISTKDLNLGCDIEKIAFRKKEFIHDYFTEKEKNFLVQADKEYHDLWTNLIWSAKESAMKLQRTGLRVDTRSLEVEFFPGHQQNKAYKLKVHSDQTQNYYYGNWWYDPPFVFTIVSTNNQVKLVEIIEYN